MTALNGASTAMAYAAATDTSGDGTAQTRKGGPMIDNFALGLTHGLMMLAAGQGHTILIEAEGADARAALEALIKLVENGFGEED